MSRDTDQPAVGYKNPPQHSRFQKGKSGNPSGRRKAKPQLNMFDELYKLMSEPIPIMKKGKQQSVSLLEALLRKTAEAALKGDSAARKDLIKLMELAPRVSEVDAGEMTKEQEDQLVALFLARQRRSDGGCDA
ncbi:DUF5681 domain-containing protein [Bosea sp. 124]|uniref:DUF5681 domain-containing protein n=1 Tax=Bosea sp. 124 TaxID=2135642 RepID=UPI000D37421A|nr:DUF5681 domain-containing protein [Bosea sp. 124]PTM40306.1 hypothetical protein C8D03_1819 [Bosea sp. 124]